MLYESIGVNIAEHVGVVAKHCKVMSCPLHLRLENRGEEGLNGVCHTTLIQL